MSEVFDWNPPTHYNFARDAIDRLAKERPDDRAMLWTDGGGKVRQAMRPIIGIDNVARWIAGASQRPYEGVEIADMAAEVVEINGAPGIVLTGAGRVIARMGQQKATANASARSRWSAGRPRMVLKECRCMADL